MQWFLLKGLVKNSQCTPANLCHTGNDVQNELPIKTREDIISRDSDSRHNTLLTLKKSKQESVREPMGEGVADVSLNKNSLKRKKKQNQNQNIHASC